MPTNQTFMALFKGMAPGLNAAGQIPGLAYLANIVSKAASYTVSPTDSGTVFVATTGAVTFTLPAVANAAGCVFEFVNSVDANMAVTAPSGKLVADGNAAATTATWSTASHKIGGACKIYCDGALYYLFSCGNLSAVPTIS